MEEVQEEVIEDEQTGVIPDTATLIAEYLDGLDFSIEIYADYSGKTLHLGDQVTLIARLKGYSKTDYRIQCQYSKDNSSWHDISGANGTSYTFTLNENNYDNYWHVKVTVSAVDIPDSLFVEE